jgi:hypothetical protein
MTDDPAKRLDELDLDPITLPVFGSFEPIVRTGDLLHTMGHWPLDGDQPVTGSATTSTSTAGFARPASPRWRSSGRSPTSSATSHG